MSKEFDNISSTGIREALAAAGESFSLSEVLKSFAPKDMESLRSRAERMVAADETYFYDEQWQCRSRRSFFNGMKFLITPDDWEINTGILFPGHRFVPYVAEDVFPSTVEMRINDAPAAMKKVIVPLGTSFHYHILLGSEQIFDFLLADDPANEILKERASRTDSVTLTVFDLAEFYKKHDFIFGDALLCTVVDYEKGIVSAEFYSGSERSSQAQKNYLKNMDAAAEKVWNKFQDYLDIPEQLAWMVFYAGSQELPGASIDEFITGSEKVQLRPEGDHAVLTVASEDELHDHECGDDCSCHHHHDDEDASFLPEGLSISENDLDDPFKLLAACGVPLTAQELDGYILDAIYGRETDFSGVHSRIFNSSQNELTDEAQQAVLLNFLEERFEVLLENYNRADDEPKAELRSQIMESVGRRLEYLTILGGNSGDLKESDREKLRQLAEVAAKLGETLKMLNHPGFTPDEKELEDMGNLIDDQLAIQEEIISDFSTDADQ